MKELLLWAADLSVVCTKTIKLLYRRKLLYKGDRNEDMGE
jgi:hypothetical protein